MSAATSANPSARHVAEPGSAARRNSFDPGAPGWLGLFARLGIGFSPDLLGLDDPPARVGAICRLALHQSPDFNLHSSLNATAIAPRKPCSSHVPFSAARQIR
jgi:hypothetical protein